jgi:hypothetical protein
MTEADLERLFWEEFDGPPSATRLERLEELSHRRPEAKRQLEELRAVAAELESVEEVAPPPELRIAVRRLVADRPAHGQGAGAPLLNWLQQTLAGGWRPRLAYATLGVLVGVFCTYLVIGGPAPMSGTDRSRLSGTLNVDADVQPESLEVALADSAGSLRFDIDGTSLIATLLPTASETLELVIRSDDRLELLRVEEIRASRHEVTAAAGTVRLVANGPVSMVLAVGDEPPMVLAVQVSTSAGIELLNRQLDLSRPPG